MERRREDIVRGEGSPAKIVFMHGQPRRKDREKSFKRLPFAEQS